MVKGVGVESMQSKVSGHEISFFNDDRLDSSLLLAEASHRRRILTLLSTE